ncbi:hypothetical protein C2I36_08055 [Rhodobacteraceae bacterium WD3A24]|nr:hypothetical protein C2I36_08055 [Rhodobacteraceae bacterium WD3A24]
MEDAAMTEEKEPHRLEVEVPCLCSTCRSEAVIGAAMMLEREAVNNGDERESSPIGIMMIALCRMMIRSSLRRERALKLIRDAYRRTEAVEGPILQAKRRRMN